MNESSGKLSILGNFESESEAGFVYLGNSITAQLHSYVDFVHDGIESHLGVNRKIVKAGLGGVGSLALCGWLDFLVLRHQPSVCLIECSAADIAGASPLLKLRQGLESMVTVLLQHSITPIFIHIPRFDVTREQTAEVLGIYHGVANEFQVIELDLWKYTLMPTGAEEATVISLSMFKDGVHTTPAGSAVIGQLILDELNWSECSINVRAKSYSQVRFQHVGSSSLAAGARAKFRGVLPYSRYRDGIPFIYQADDRQVVGLYVLVGPDAGVIEVSTNEMNVRIQLFDQWCDRDRIQFVNLADLDIQFSALHIELSDFETGERNAWGLPTSIARVGSSFDLLGVLVQGSYVEGEKEQVPWWI